MNPLTKHKILQYLPNELLKNPEKNTMQEFLKKSRIFGRLQLAMIVAFIAYLILLYIFETVHTTIQELAIFDNIFNLIPLPIFLGLAIAFHVRRKKYTIPENEVEDVIKNIKSQQATA